MYNYFYSYWIDEVGVTTFSVYGLLDRTINLVESWHCWFNALYQRSTLTSGILSVNINNLVCLSNNQINSVFFLECLRKAENQKARDYLCAVEEAKLEGQEL